MQSVLVDQFNNYFSTATELSSAALGGTICSVSDEFFAEAHHLLLVEPAPSLKGQFGPKGALFSGWETRRHNPTYDWCVIKLGTAGSIAGFDVDTSHFNGNEAPQVSIDALYVPDDGKSPEHDHPEWTEILPKVNLGPNSRHLFKIPPTSRLNHVKLNMYPDGGIARFRVYGLVAPVFPPDDHTAFDLAHVFSGGRVIFTSDQHFGVGSNLILPGRGKDMGDGWETRRSRTPGHKCWAIIRLGTTGILSHTEIDTAHFMGNFPESCELHAINSSSLMPSGTDDDWTLILPRTQLGPHRQHQFQLENVHDKTFTHVKVTIYPDGGIKRVRIFGRRPGSRSSITTSDMRIPDESEEISEFPSTSPQIQENLLDESTDASKSSATSQQSQPQARCATVIPALALTPEAFSPFGQVIQAYADVNGVPSPRKTKITEANQGSALKFHKLAPILSSYPLGSGATAGLSVYRCNPTELSNEGDWAVKLLERHPYTNQAFIPMGGKGPASQSDGLDDPGNRYLVVVTKNGDDDKPDLQSMRAFIATSSQGIVYNTGIWHHPMLALDRALDFTCVETQIGNGDRSDCEIIDLDGSLGYHMVQIPSVEKPIHTERPAVSVGVKIVQVPNFLFSHFHHVGG